MKEYFRLKSLVDIQFVSLGLACLINMSHQSGNLLRYKNEIIQKVTLRQFHELMEKSKNSKTISHQVFLLLRNLVDENNVLLESKGKHLVTFITRLIKSL